MGNVGEIIEDMGMPQSPTFLSSDNSSMMPLLALNHVSFVCKSVPRSVRFYEEVLDFVLIKRPSSFDFEGAWLFNHGVGIHLIESENAPAKKDKINPKDNHISFQCTDMNLIIERLKQMNIEYVTAVVREGGITVDQLFFHDPDSYMIEICNCQNLPPIPISSCPIKLSNSNRNQMTAPFLGKRGTQIPCAAEVAYLMLENFVVNMFDISI